MPRPVWPSASGARCVQTCMREVLNQTNQGSSAPVLSRMNFSALSATSLSKVFMRSRVRGPVSSQRCLPQAPKRSLSGSELTSSVAKQWKTPRGPKFFLNSALFG